MEDKIKTVIEILKNGQSITIGELRLGAEEPGVIEVTGWSRYKSFSNLTKQQCLRELEEIKNLFYKIVNSNSELKTFINSKLVEFNLYFDDYGKGSIALCSEKDDEIEWIADLN